MMNERKGINTGHGLESGYKTWLMQFTRKQLE